MPLLLRKNMFCLYNIATEAIPRRDTGLGKKEVADSCSRCLVRSSSLLVGMNKTTTKKLKRRPTTNHFLTNRKTNNHLCNTRWLSPSSSGYPHHYLSYACVCRERKSIPAKAKLIETLFQNGGNLVLRLRSNGKWKRANRDVKKNRWT